MIELTCPAEEGIAEAHARKLDRYEQLRAYISGNTCWSAEVIAIEVGARGFVASSVRHCALKLGFKTTRIKRLFKDLGEVVSRCSYHIHLAHDKLGWQKPPLIQPCNQNTTPDG